MRAAEIEAHLRQHPQVREAKVLESGDTRDGSELVAYVVPDLEQLKALNAVQERRANADIVRRWNRLYELTYAGAPPAPSFAGWNSSYTRQPIPLDEMQEWLANTVARIRSLKPRRCLEIGCGVGLLLQHLAPHCEKYVGTDFSAAALDPLSRWTSAQDELRHVELLHRAATELHDIPDGSFDTVVLNSVIQYFPDIQYLVTVLREAVRLLAPGGRVFVGDVRNLALLRTFHSAVQLSRAEDSLDLGRLRRRIERAVTQETELVIDPGFFEALPARLPGIAAVDVQLKRGRTQNELTRYRYDAVLYQGERPSQQATLELSPLDNGRLASEWAARELVEASADSASVASLRGRLERLEAEGADPEWFWKWGEASGRELSIGWARDGMPGCFSVRLNGTPDTARARRVVSSASVEKPWSDYANDPGGNRVGQQFGIQVREYLAGRVPASRIPSEWMVLARLPEELR